MVNGDPGPVVTFFCTLPSFSRKILSFPKNQ